MNQAELQALIEQIRELTFLGIKLTEIEKTLNMPRNSLSGMLNGTRHFSHKWKPKLLAFVQSQKKYNKIVVSASTIEKIRKSKVIQPAPQPVLHVEEKLFSKIPPEGLSRTQMIRWYRENQVSQ